MQGKDRDKDRWLGAVRMPFEGGFARLNKRARYRGTIKNQFQALMQAFTHNLKHLIKIETVPIPPDRGLKGAVCPITPRGRK